MESISINSGDPSHLASAISKNIGNHVCFANGCSLWLVDEDGMYWGTCPYGQTWGCQADQNSVESILRWINYWNTSRTETGELVENLY